MENSQQNIQILIAASKILKTKVHNQIQILKLQTFDIKQLKTQCTNAIQINTKLTNQINSLRKSLMLNSQFQKTLEYSILLQNNLYSTKQSILSQKCQLKSCYDQLKSESATEQYTLSIQDSINDLQKNDSPDFMRFSQFSNLSEYESSEQDETKCISNSQLNFYKNKSQLLSQFKNKNHLSKQDIKQILTQSEKQIYQNVKIEEFSNQSQFLSNFYENKIQNLSKAQIKALFRKTEIVIPFQMREQIWMKLIGDDLFITSQYYQIIHNKLSSINIISKKTIKQDLKRTFPHITLFKEEEMFYLDLKQILEMFDITYKDMGYVQGMAYPASLLLMVMPKISAFKCLCNLLIINDFVSSMYRFDQYDYELKIKIFDYMLKKYVPKIWKHFYKSHISCQVLLVQWFFSMYCRAFKLSVVMKVWDRFLLEGQKIFYLTAISILKILEKRILEFDGDESFIKIKELSRKIEFEELSKMIDKLNVDEQKYMDIVESCLNK